MSSSKIVLASAEEIDRREKMENGAVDGGEDETMQTENGWLGKKSTTNGNGGVKRKRDESAGATEGDDDAADDSDSEGWTSSKRQKEEKFRDWGWKKAERKKDHWKLTMMRKISSITFRFSDRCSCARLVFEDKDKHVMHKDGSVSTRIRLCEECVDLNIEANDALGKFYEKKNYGQNGKK